MNRTSSTASGTRPTRPDAGRPRRAVRRRRRATIATAAAAVLVASCSVGEPDAGDAPRAGASADGDEATGVASSGGPADGRVGPGDEARGDGGPGGDGTDGGRDGRSDDGAGDGGATDGSGDEGGGDDGGGTVRGGGGGPVGFAGGALAAFDDCDALLGHVRAEGLERVGPFGFDAGWWGRTVTDDAMTESTTASAVDGGRGVGEATAGTGDAAATTGPADGGVSGTNVQVEGVDEPDVVKTDGERIVAISDGALHVVDVAGRARRGSVPLVASSGVPVDGVDLLVRGDRALAIVRSDRGVVVDGALVDARVTDVDELPPVDESDVRPVDPTVAPAPLATTSVVEVDLRDPAAPAVVATLTLEGRYVSARAIDGTARLVLTTPPSGLDFVVPGGQSSTDRATEVNRQVIEESDLDDWLPSYTLLDAGGAVAGEGPLVACDRVEAPEEFAGFDVLSVLTLPLDQPLSAPTATTSVLASGETVYASSDRLYVAVNEWVAPGADPAASVVDDGEYDTSVHRFSLPPGAPAEYEASGTVAGHVLDQFSMHDDGDTFFVATTEGAPWSEGTESSITALRADGRRLVEVGRVGGLGRGERIFSVRYLDGAAYVVTFRQTDPFYVVDLRDPAAMSVDGELKIPGVSNYLHPLGDDLVLGVGQDATDTGRTTGSKVSLFDVSDPTAPTELAVWSLPGATSDVEFDHRAFLWWAATGTAVVPLVGGERGPGAVVLDVSRGGIVERGWLSHRDVDDPIGRTDCRVLDPSELDESDGELWWTSREGQVGLCGADQRGGAIGHTCSPVRLDDLAGWGISLERLGERVDLAGVDRLELCWPDGGAWAAEAIRRSMVIDGELWTLSRLRLQADALTSLDRLAVVPLA